MKERDDAQYGGMPCPKKKKTKKARKQAKKRTGIGHGDGRGALVAEAVEEGAAEDEDDGAAKAEDAAPEDGRALARRPPPVPQGAGPEARGDGHGSVRFELDSYVFVGGWLVGDR